jgi:hypothetical protein
LLNNIQFYEQAKSYKDPAGARYLRSKVVDITSGVQIFKPIATMLLQ